MSLPYSILNNLDGNSKEYTDYVFSSIPAPTMQSYSKVLSSSDILNMGAPSYTAIGVTLGDLGLTGNQVAKIYPHLTEWYVYPDGTPFAESIGGEQIVFRYMAGSSIITSLPVNEFSFSATNIMMVSGVSNVGDRVIHYTIGNGYYFMVIGGSIINGGASAYIRVKLYYEILDITF